MSAFEEVLQDEEGLDAHGRALVLDALQQLVRKLLRDVPALKRLLCASGKGGQRRVAGRWKGGVQRAEGLEGCGYW